MFFQTEIDKEWFTTTLNSIGDGVIVCDKIGIITFMNPVAERLTGHKGIGYRIKKVFNPFNEKEMADDENPALIVLQNGKNKKSNHSILKSKQGESIDISYRAYPIIDSKNDIIGVVLVFRNISDQIKAEKSLIEQREWLEETLMSLGEAVITTDSEANITFINPIAEDLTGWLLEEAKGKTIEEICNIDMTQYNESVTIKEETELFPQRIYLVNRNGKRIPVEINEAPIKRKTGKLYGIVLVIRDISERVDAQIKQQQLLEELKRSNQELELFAYVASHDLQEPLRMVSSFVKLLSSRYEGKIDKDADEFINYTIEGTTRMQKLINDLLAYSRVSTGEKLFDEINTDSIVKQVLTNLKDKINESQVKFKIRNLPIIHGNESQIFQLFQNLIGNAIKFRRDSNPKIELSADFKNNKWIFKVSDNGIGIDPKDHEKIFVIFKRLYSHKKYPGTGIGLSISKKIIERHGGRIWVDSELGKGTTFYFTIPSNYNG
ncbi:MAG: ATP-binding protein [Candidatus Hodarchaeales archaeon]